MGEIERSAAMPSHATAEKLAHALDVALSELISRCERPGQCGDGEGGLEHQVLLLWLENHRAAASRDCW